MKKIILFILLTIVSCNEKNEKEKADKKASSNHVTTSNYELYKADDQKGLLILFPCYPCNAKNTLKELEIKDIGLENGFSVLAMNLNERLYLEDEEKELIAKNIVGIIEEQNLSKNNIFIGGFSSGGNISLLISSYLNRNNNKQIKLEGVFIVDSPVDLLGLYKVAQKNIDQNFSKPSVEESKWIIESLKQDFGDPENSISKFEMYSPYTFKTQNIENIKNLENLEIRFYTEPDLKWWKENAKNDYEDLNAFYIKELSKTLKARFKKSKIELIETKNSGYRKSGDRHPHSWSIVDETDLIKWMKE